MTDQKKLAISEFVANNNELASTNLFLFFAFKDLHLYIRFDIVDLSNASIHKQIHK